MKTAYLLDLGIVCTLGQGQKDVAQALFYQGFKNESPDWTLISKKKVPVGRVNIELPQLDSKFDKFSSRNNRMLKVALDEISESVAKAVSTYGASRVGVVMGTSTSGMLEEEKAFIHKNQTGKLPLGHCIEKTEVSSPSCFTSKYFDLKGPSHTISTACSSTGKALCSARRLITSGICDAVVVGGVDSLCEMTLNGFESLELLSSKRSVPFSKNRDGINIGEGAAVFLVSAEKPAEDAIELAGYGETSDAYHISCPEPSGNGAEASINKALIMAGITAQDITYVNLHGTGTPLNDAMESSVINRIFGNDVLCSSTKGLTGHTLGASGAIEAAFLWLALSNEENGEVRVPPHTWDEIADTDLPPLKFSNYGDKVSKVLNSYCFMSNSFAFGGSNVNIVLRKHVEMKKPVADLLPHDPPMVLIDRVVDCKTSSIHTQVNITPESQFCFNAEVPSYVAIEYMAQTIAAWSGITAKQNGQTPRIGFLLGTRRMDLGVPSFKVGQVLDVFGHVKYVDGEMASFECHISIDQHICIRATLNVYQPKDDRFIHGDQNEFTK